MHGLEAHYRTHYEVFYKETGFEKSDSSPESGSTNKAPMGLFTLLSDIWIYLLIALEIAAIVVAVHIVLSNRDVPSTVGWTGLVLLTPLTGLLLYWLFGINRIERKAHRLRPVASRQGGEDFVASEVYPHRLSERCPELVPLGHLGDGLTPSVLKDGNRVTPLMNGDMAYPEMLAVIDTAERSIALSSYIFDNDAAGALFVEALLRAQGRGIAVRVLIDGVGQRYSRPRMPKVLRRYDIPVAVFHESVIPVRNPYLNLRNHRKILVVDGRIGFTGGMNIREGCLLERGPAHPVQDLHFRIDGPVVHDLMDTFALDWNFTTGESLGGDDWYPVLKPVGGTLARCVADGPDEDFDVIRRLFLGALTQARRRVRVVTPYFLPDQTLITALNVTALRGVEVQILIPGKNNLRFVQWAAEAQAEQILAGGSRIFLTCPPFDHTKLLLVDDIWCCIGSANWDPRSLRLNFELNVECFDSELATRLNGLVDEKLRTATELDANDLRGGRLPLRMRNGIARLFSPYL